MVIPWKWWILELFIGIFDDECWVKENLDREKYS
jgi:hypothetical protein